MGEEEQGNINGRKLLEIRLPRLLILIECPFPHPAVPDQLQRSADLTSYPSPEAAAIAKTTIQIYGSRVGES